MMEDFIRLLRDRDFAAAGYLAGWSLVGVLPAPVAARLFQFGADRVSDDGKGLEMLRRNLSRVVGPENVTAGTDCGLGGRLHPDIAVAKLESLGRGAEIAADRLSRRVAATP